MSDTQGNSTPDTSPWLERGDQLFQSGVDWWHNACLNWCLEEWGLYITGYKKAGDVLVDYIQTTRRNQDVLIFPIVFVYRQYLELRLKKLIRDCRCLLDEDQIFPKSHDLQRLWTECRQLLERLEPKVERKDLEAVDDAMRQFYGVDPDSQSFRYPANTRGEKSLPTDLKYINVRNLSDVMARLSGFFEAGDVMVSVYLEHKNDMRG